MTLIIGYNVIKYCCVFADEREWMLCHSGILSLSKLEEVDIWTMLICKASRYPMALFSYDIEQKAQLRKEMLAFLNELEEKNK